LIVAIRETSIARHPALSTCFANQHHGSTISRGRLCRQRLQIKARAEPAFFGQAGILYKEQRGVAGKP